MLDKSSITIHRVGGTGIPYGDPLHPDDCPHVWDAVEDDVIETDEDDGEVRVGGQRWHWSRI